MVKKYVPAQHGTTKDKFELAQALDLDASLVASPWSFVFPAGPGTAGYVLQSTGGGQLVWAAVGAAEDQTTPYFIPAGETFTNRENKQNLFNVPITIEGDLVVDGLLIQV